MGTENAEFEEIHTVTTNTNGLFSIKVGGGTLVSGDFTTAMSSGAYSKKIKCEIDPTGGTNYTIVSNEQLLSVPYALKANTASFAYNVDSVPIKYYILVFGIYAVPKIVDRVSNNSIVQGDRLDAVGGSKKEDHKLVKIGPAPKFELTDQNGKKNHQ